MARNNHLRDCGISRRDMIRIGAGGLGFGLFGGIGPVPYVFGKASEVAAASTSDKILVVFEWFGGNDGLNTIVPYGDPMYYKHRPTIGIKEKDVLKIDEHFGWQRSMGGMKRRTGLRNGSLRALKKGAAGWYGLTHDITACAMITTMKTSTINSAPIAAFTCSR